MKKKKAILYERKQKTVRQMMTDPDGAISVMGLKWDNVIGMKYKAKEKKMSIEFLQGSTVIEVTGPLLELEVEEQDPPGIARHDPA